MSDDAPTIGVRLPRDTYRRLIEQSQTDRRSPRTLVREVLINHYGPRAEETFNGNRTR